ncbi:hypothetical protein ACMD2_21752 [Ananas comosus]|uniref:Uncharacterized protein n=1 Tax=Ananas comosus TaxID=4615 RepID=A0A199VC75_ANACO|nr:hypothetical protein ACMD2_21752 [Ananas comosus]
MTSKNRAAKAEVAVACYASAPSKACCLCFVLLLAILVVGLIFGFGVFSRGFHKLKGTIHLHLHHHHHHH